jgi:hypothetical protein
MKQAYQDYRDALEHTAQIEEVLATQFAMLADELEKQCQHRVADLLQAASRHHKDRSIKNRALVASLVN